MDIAENIRHFKSILPPSVEMVAVSKFHPAEAILQAYNAGQRLFGESRVQEFLEKQKVLPKDIRWHFIGHLQTNKVRPIIGKTSLIESVDSERLLDLIDKESARAGVVSKVLLQVHVAAEEAKFGFFPQQLLDFLLSKRHESLPSVQICGIMGMATNTDRIQRIKADFHSLRSLFLKIRDYPDLNLPHFSLLSMGMSGDWQYAVEEGADIIRIGSAIFGSRY